MSEEKPTKEEVIAIYDNAAEIAEQIFNQQLRKLPMVIQAHAIAILCGVFYRQHPPLAELFDQLIKMECEESSLEREKRQ